MDAATRVLVLANRTADSVELYEHLLSRHRASRISITLLAPAAWEIDDPHGGRVSAMRRLRDAKQRLEADGIDVLTMLGDPDPMTAFEQEWRRRQYAEVVVSTLGSRLSRWLRIDLPSRIQRVVGGPISHVVVGNGTTGRMPTGVNELAAGA